MEQHPIPQQISSYQFRLVGDMTLKQFFQIGGGALVAIILYTSGLPFYIKWPLIFVSFLFGVALAFFPVEDRPLSKWIFLFVRSIYSPTLYVWMKNFQTPQYFQPEGVAVPGVTVQQPQPIVQQVVASQDIPQALEQGEEQFLNHVANQLSGTSVTHQVISETQSNDSIMTPLQRQEALALNQELTGATKGHEVLVPEAPVIAVEKTDIPSPLSVIQNEGHEDITVGYTVTPLSGQKEESTRMQAQFSNDAAPPTPATRPNIIVGQVMDAHGKILENAILEITDEEGRPVRALKSNRLGHFMIVTPLANGTYRISIEKEGFVFEPIQLTITGEVLPPIAIRAK